MAEAREKVPAFVFLEHLSQLGAAPRLRQASMLCPADQTAVQGDCFPRSARRWKVGIGRAMARV